MGRVDNRRAVQAFSQAVAADDRVLEAFLGGGVDPVS
jgi:hypothetical protein